MKTLILSCNTGEGHNACARAIKEYYDSMGEDSEIKDALAFVSEEISKIVAKGHVFIYRKLSPVFDWGYEYAQNHPETFDEDSRLYHFFARGTQSLYEYIGENGFDQIICTHPFAALMVTELRRRCNLQVDTAFVATDYTCCPGVNCSDLDVYFIPDEMLVEEFSESGIPAEKIIPSGIPIRQAFYGSTHQETCKEQFQVPAKNRHIVMACGSMGCGPMEELADMIAPRLGDNRDLTIVCGTNEKLQSTMEQTHGGNPRVHVRGFVKDMPALVSSADVYVTKPGGLSVTEALAKHAFMVLVNAVGGCEDYNLNHLLAEGKAVTAETVEELAEACLRGNPEPVQEDEERVSNAAKRIYDTMRKRNEAHEAQDLAAACPAGGLS